MNAGNQLLNFIIYTKRVLTNLTPCFRNIRKFMYIHPLSVYDESVTQLIGILLSATPLYHSFFLPIKYPL